MFHSFLAASSALFFAFRFWCNLKIQRKEATRYLTKSLNLGLCYGAFVKPVTIRGSLAAGRTAFLCCAYDVVTDWRSFSPEYRDLFEEQLRQLAPSWAVELTMDLYSADLQGILKDDGLERGSIAVEFITGIIGSGAFFSDFGIQDLGLLLQIADDILDFEHDVQNSELNCLATPRATKHLAFFKKHERRLLDLFRTDRAMYAVISHAGRKAKNSREWLP